jgi:hypothetical protein
VGRQNDKQKLLAKKAALEILTPILKGEIRYCFSLRSLGALESPLNVFTKPL